jgi:hypothetical protein
MLLPINQYESLPINELLDMTVKQLITQQKTVCNAKSQYFKSLLCLYRGGLTTRHLDSSISCMNACKYIQL